MPNQSEDGPHSASVGEDDTLTVWSRYRDGDVDENRHISFGLLNLHRFCYVFPFNKTRDDTAVTSREESTNVDQQEGGENSTEPSDGTVDIRYLTGLPRVALRHTPIAMVFVTVLFFGSAEVTGKVDGLSAFLPDLSTVELAGVGVFLCFWGLIFALLILVDIIEPRTLYLIGVVYGLLSFLGACTVLSVGLVTVGDPNETPPNIVFVSGYLLMATLGGMYTYDGMLRVEYLFENLDRTTLIKNDTRAQEAYAERKKQLRDNLTHTLPKKGSISVKTAYVFALLIVAQFAAVWWYSTGPQNLDFSVTFVGNVVLDIALTVIAFQFLILIHWFYKLINDDLLSEGVLLAYKPFHPDGHGGYRDLGKFATRVNLLLVIGGFYCVYRLFVQGSRVTPEEMADGFDPVVGEILWGVSFVGPVVAYALCAVIWFYYSFWQIHLRMAREREQLYYEKTDSLTGSENWEYRTAPAWPIEIGTLFSVITASIGPLLPLVDLLPIP